MLLVRTRLATSRLIGAALLALLLGQWSILTHAVAHAQAYDVVEQSVHGDHAHAHDHGWGHQAGTPTCDLIDHLLTGQAPGAEPTAGLWLPPETSHSAAGAASNAPGPVVRAYEARGPPEA